MGCLTPGRAQANLLRVRTPLFISTTLSCLACSWFTVKISPIDYRSPIPSSSLSPISNESRPTRVKPELQLMGAGMPCSKSEQALHHHEAEDSTIQDRIHGRRIQSRTAPPCVCYLRLAL
mmetsp:Transcript_12314/g.34144  ORF Transcript_12314/g.34144 Transcript_12314/m.34144 type:complete len:120 (-) Transcript_12314:55-414(-)